MKRSRGVTLVEVMVGIMISSSVLVMLAVVMSRMIGSNARAQEHLETIVALDRLSEQLRRDAHAAANAQVEEVSEKPLRMQLATVDGASITYEITPAGIQRVAKTAGDKTSRELFALASLAPSGWTLADDGRALSLSIGRLARPGTADDTQSGTFTVLARVGHHAPPGTP